MNEKDTRFWRGALIGAAFGVAFYALTFWLSAYVVEWMKSG